MISFDNTEYAFAYKNDRELKKARFLFSSMGKPWLVALGLKLTPTAMKINFPFTKKIIRNTIFKQFVGGETLQETAPAAARLSQYKVNVILDYGVEGGSDDEAGFEHAADEFIRVINYAASRPNIPFMSIKITGLVRFSLLETIDSGMRVATGSLIKKYQSVLEALNPEEQHTWQKLVARIHRICSAGAASGVGVLVDAEESWIQDPVDALTMLMMDAYNKTKPVVYNTIQLYRHDRLDFLHKSYEAALERGFILAVKPVRGAYMEKERKRAAERNYPSPIQPDKAATDRDYNKAIEFCISRIDRTAFIVASHNEYSNLYTTELMDNKNIAHDHPHVHFSQLYGMSDNITFNLAKAGFSVSKYLPFGPLDDVIPYLMRRARENSSVSGQTGRELGLIEKEFARRKAAMK